MSGNIQYPDTQRPSQNPNCNPAQMNLIFRARMLWRDISTWLHLYMVSLFANSTVNQEVISERLHRAPAEYGSILRVFFSNQVTEQLVNQSVKYLAVLQSLYIALLNNDVDSINYYTRQAYQVVDAIATLLANTNPYWAKNEWVALLTAYTNTNIQQATTMLAGEYKNSVDIFERNLSITNIMGDYFSQGLTNYFMLNTPQQTP